VEGGIGDEERERIFPRKTDDSHQDVEDLKDRERFYGAFQRSAQKMLVRIAKRGIGELVGLLCPDVEKHFGVEDAVDTSYNLVRGGGHDDQAREVVLDKTAHCFCVVAETSKQKVIYRED
jgi:hypothetical protein